MKGKLRELKPCEVFYFFNEKLHFVGIAESREAIVYVFWAWNRNTQRRYYRAFPLWQMELDWEYFREIKQDKK